MNSKYIIIAIVSLAFFCNRPTKAEQKNVELLFNEARAAYTLINQIRNNPSAYSEKMGVNLDTVKKRNSLIWNEKLSKAAQNKAKDLAARDYWGHFTPEGKSPAYFAVREGYYLPLKWPNLDKINYIESISGGGSRSGYEHIKNLIFDNGAPHSSPKANHRKHLLGMNEFWAKHIHIGIGFAYNPRSKYRGYLVVFTGIPGVPYSIISGKLFAPNKTKTNKAIENIWIGAIDSKKNKFWTQTAIPIGKNRITYQIRVPQNSRIVIRYFKQYKNGEFSRGYYSKNGTVHKKDRADVLKVGTENISNIDLNFKNNR